MWKIDKPELRTAILNFSSSGQAGREVSQLYSEDVQLINALELVDWDTEEQQFLICEACGYTGCKVGDWVSLRLAEPLILILPPFDAHPEDEETNSEYAPPWYSGKDGMSERTGGTRRFSSFRMAVRVQRQAGSLSD